MKKFSVILSSLLLIIFLSTFNPNNLQIEPQFFKIKEIEIKNLKYLNKKRDKTYNVRPTNWHKFNYFK